MFRAKKYKPRKRTTDYSDYAYREAVSKLKYLLAESYTPITVQKFSPGGQLYKIPYHSSYEHLAGSDSSYIPRVRPSTVLVPPKMPELSSSTPPELVSYMRKQEDYIGHLEKESHSCRDELTKMLEKVKEVIKENKKLRDQRKSIDGSGFDSEESDKEPKITCKHSSAPNIVFQSKISELQAQLTQSRIELRRAQDEALSLKLQKPIDTSSPYGTETNKQIEALQREREDLNNTISNLQALVSQLRDKEASATQKVKRSLDLVDQAHFDKNQVIDALELEVRRLKSEIERMQDKQREAIQDSARRVNEAERRYAMQIEQLNGDLATQWDTANRLNLDLDRSRRTEQELRRELAQKSSTIEELKKELNSKTSSLQTEALTAGAERENLESELANSKLAIERAERSGRQETSRLQAEVVSLRQRLDRADADLLHTRKENLRLTDNLASIDKELELVKLDKETSKNSKKNEELALMIKDMDAKHVQSVADLEGMIQSQTQLMEKLKNECQMLTERLEDSSARHKEEMAGLQSNIEYLNSKLEAPVNYENQEWRDDGMNNYPEDRQYDGVNGDNNDNNVNNYEKVNDVGYSQNGGYQGDGEVYAGDQAYTGQDGAIYPGDGTGYAPDSRGYPADTNYPPEVAPYPENIPYAADSSYPPDGSTYPADNSVDPTDPSAYPADTNAYPVESSTYSEHPSTYPTDTANYPAEGETYKTEKVPYVEPAETDLPKTIQPVVEDTSKESTPVYGIDNNGGGIVEPQEFIPQTGQ